MNLINASKKNFKYFIQSRINESNICICNASPRHKDDAAILRQVQDTRHRHF